MKKIKLIAITALLSSLSYAQTAPVGAPPFPVTLPNQAASAWYRGGNNAVGATPPTSNVFGTMFNAAIHTKTNSILRSKLNGTVAYNVNGFVAARDGYMLLGPDAPVGGGSLYNTKGAFSLLHLNGTTTLAAIELGYRPWMKTGITFTENSDLMYVGRKSEGTGPSTADQTDAVIAWADDGSGPPFFGPDNLRFMFTFGNAAGTSAPNGDLTGGGMDGREVMRMTPQGNVGVGPRFDNSFQPQSTYHQNQENNLSSWMQVTNQMTGNGLVTNTGPTIVTPNDGFRWGILGAPTAVQNGNAFIYNQEERHIIFSTGSPTPGNMATTGERVRITALENPTTLSTGAYGIYNPSGINPDFTRVAMSINPATPINRPMSLLHLGYDVGLLTPGSTDGWRPWMNIGMYIGDFGDGAYLGMKNEGGFDRSDAILNWSDNNASLPGVGPDNFRFIFTSKITGTDNAAGLNGLEALRMTPTLTAGVFTGIGGDPTANPYFGGSINPTQTLEVNSWGTTATLGGSSGLRFTNLNSTSPILAVNPGPGVLAVDANGDVVYVPGGGNGLGNLCGAATTNPLPGDWEIPMANFNYHFSDAGSTAASNNVGIGTNCGVLNAKLQVVNTAMNIGIDATTSKPAGNNIGIRGDALNGVSNSIGVYGQAITVGPVFNTGVYGRATNSIQTNYGGQFFASGASSQSIGVNASATGASAANYGVLANANGGTDAIGVYAQASSGTTVSYAIYGTAAPSSGGGTPNDSYAGFFNGDVFISGTTYPSDSTIKQNIDTLENALAMLKQLKPKTFEYNHSVHPQMNLRNGAQYGLIAQEVELVVPDLVTENTFPATYDTAGIVTNPSFQIKGVDYLQIIPILIKGMQEQQSTIDSLKDENNVQDSINTSLQNQINQLATLINSCCNSHSMQSNNSNQSITSQDVNLKDGQAIVLEQNVPNPFAEQTTINYFLPDNVVKAQILFYNVSGKLIQSVDLNEKGKGSLNVFASDLSNGIYTYTLVVDGQIIETKKMVKQQ